MRMYFSEALQRDGVQHPVVLPRMLTIDQLIEDLSSLTPHDELRAVCRLHRIYCKYTGSTMPLDAFYGWGRQLLQDFSNIESTLADPEKVISNLAEAQVLDNEPLDKDQLEALQQRIDAEIFHGFMVKPAEYLSGFYTGAIGSSSWYKRCLFARHS